MLTVLISPFGFICSLFSSLFSYDFGSYLLFKSVFIKFRHFSNLPLTK